MNVTVEKTSNVEGKIIVNVVEADYADKVKKELRNIGQKHPLPGFRAGHVPMDQLKKRFGRQVKSDVLNDEVYRAVIEYIRENKLHVLGEPMPVEKKEVNLEDKDYTFEYFIGLAPELGLTVDTNDKLPYYEIEVSKEMMDEQDNSLRERFGAQVPGEEVDAKAVVQGALMQLNDDHTVNENDGAIQVINGILAPFTFTDDEQKALFLGKKVNDKVVFNPFKATNGNAVELASMLNIDREIAADIHSDFEMAISEIIVVKQAEHNQEFYDNVFGKDKVKTEEEYEKALREMIAGGLVGNSQAWFEHDYQDYFVKKYDNMELPVEFLKKWLVASNEELTAENIDEEFAKMLPSIKWEMVKGALQQALDVKVEEKDVLDHAKAIAYRQFAQYGITNMDEATITDTARRILADKNYGPRIAEQVADIKLSQAIMNAITVEKKTVTLDEFKKMVGAA